MVRGFRSDRDGVATYEQACFCLAILRLPGLDFPLWSLRDLCG